MNWKGSKNGYRETKNIEVIQRRKVVTYFRMVELGMEKSVPIGDVIKMNTNIKKEKSLLELKISAGGKGNV